MQTSLTGIKLDGTGALVQTAQALEFAATTTVTINITVTGQNGVPINLTGQALVLSVRTSTYYNATQILSLQATIDNAAAGTAHFTIPNTAFALARGAYVYDVTLIATNGSTDQVVPVGSLYITDSSYTPGQTITPLASQQPIGLGPTGASETMVFASSFTGADIGAQINAAMASLVAGGGGGTVYVAPGTYSMTTAVVIETNCTLKLGPNCNIVLHTAMTSSRHAAFLMKDYSTLCGTNWSSIITESDQLNAWRMVADYNYGSFTGVNPTDQDGTRYWTVRDVQMVGANPAKDSANSTIAVGNSHGVLITRVFLNGTRTLGITVGGTSNPIAGVSYFAEDCVIVDNKCLNVSSQNINCVNGKNFVISRNVLLAATQTGGSLAGYIDLEPNISTDILENFEVNDNIIDNRGAPLSTNGIIVQIGGAIGSTRLGPGTINGNTVLGNGFVGDPTDTGPQTSNGIILTGIPDVAVCGNSLRQFGQSAIYVSSTTRCSVSDNQITAPTGSAQLGITLDSTTHTLVSNNNIQVPSNALIGGGENQNIGETGTSDYNTFTGNKLVLLYYGAAGVAASYYPEIILVGAHSRAFGNDLWGRTDDSKRVTAIQTAAYTAFPNEIVQCNPTAAGFAVTLPAAAGHKGQPVQVKNVSSSANAITVTPAGTDTIDGSATYVLSGAELSVELYSDGTSNWMILPRTAGGGGTQNGATTANHVPYASGANTLADSELSFDPVTHKLTVASTTVPDFSSASSSLVVPSGGISGTGAVSIASNVAANVEGVFIKNGANTVISVQNLAAPGSAIGFYNSNGTRLYVLTATSGVGFTVEDNVGNPAPIVNLSVTSSVLNTVASAASVTLTKMVNKITGSISVTTLTPPFATFIGSLVIITAAALTFGAGGNIAASGQITTVAGQQYIATYDGTSWYIK